MPATTTSQAFPVLDIHRAPGDAVERAAFRSDRRAAARSLGFCDLCGHGIGPALVTRLRDRSKRFVSPPASVERLSIAVFVGARLDATVPPLDLPPHLAAEAGGLTRAPLNPLFHEVGRNTLQGRLRSHPDAAQRHHADLLSSGVFA